MTYTNKLALLLLVFFVDLISVRAQNIFSALQARQEREYKTRRPKKIIETNTFFNPSGKKVEKAIKTFDNAGMLLTEERFDNDGKLTARLTYDNDTLRRLHKSRVFERWNTFGNSVETAYYTYDSSGCLLSVVDKDASGNILSRTSLVCNEKGLPLELTLFDGNGNPFGKETAEYLYEMNRVVTTVWSNDGRRLSSDTIKISFLEAYKYPAANETYNAQGDLTSWVRRNRDGSTVYFEEEYSYDTYGNCTENRIYKVTISGSGKKKKANDRIFRKEYTY